MTGYRTGMDEAHLVDRAPALEELPLFAPREPEPKRWATRGKDDQEKLVTALAAIARELAEKAGPYNPATGMGGIIMADVRHIAVARKKLTGQEQGRRLSFLGNVGRAAGLVATGAFRRSTVDRSNGNLHAVWTLPPGPANG